MSAFLVEDSTINRILSFLIFSGSRSSWYFDKLNEHGYNLNLFEHRERLGHDMFKMNIDAINQRYGEGEAVKFRILDYKYHCVSVPSKVQAFKSLRCFLYQCAEGDVYQSSFYKVFDEISTKIALDIVYDLPEFEQGEWA